jgi:hypothetical protein
VGERITRTSHPGGAAAISASARSAGSAQRGAVDCRSTTTTRGGELGDMAAS